MLPREGKAAGKELQRCISKLKFVGGVVELKGTDGVCLLHSGMEEVWATAEKYRVPIALRNTWPTGAEVCYHLSD
jgi:predicted TIM-barrel fold metal-dependent hydrolase